MKRHHHNPISWILASSLLIGSAAWAAQPVAITNPGFEDPVLADGQLSSPGVVPGWSAFNSGAIRVLNPSSAADLTAQAPEGENVGLVTSSANEDGLSQSLTSTFQADADYALSVKVANTKFTAGFPGYRVQLLAGGTVLAEDNNFFNSIAEDAVETSVVSYTYIPGDAGLVGQPLEIRLLSKGLTASEEVAFDDVQLTVTLLNPAADPGGPYSVSLSGSLTLDGSGSLPSDGATITAWDWDLDNNGSFGDITGANPTPITIADLQLIYGMSIGANTIQLRVTDSAAKSSIAQATVTLTALPAPYAYWPLRDGAPGNAVPTGSGNAAEELMKSGGTFNNGTVNSTNSTWQADPTRGIVWSTTEGNRMTMGQQGIDLNNGFTWSFWVNVASSNITDPGADVIIGTRQGNATASNTTAWHKVDLGSISAWNGSMSIPNLADDTWHHVAYVGDLSGRKFYVDGVEVGSNNSIVVQTIDRVLELGGSSQFSEDVTGLYSELAIWHSRLSVAEIEDLAAGAPVIADVTAPVIASISPPNGDLEATVVDGLLAIFDEPVTIGAGDIRIYHSTGPTLVATIDVTDATQVSTTGAGILINPTTTLDGGTTYYIEMDAGVVKNASNLDFAGFTGSTTWSFTVDNLAPTVVSFGDEYNGTSFGENLTSLLYNITFNEAIDGTSVSAADFSNAGDATISIGAVTQISPEMFTVEVLPTSTGTLQLSILSGSVILDLSGNALDTTAAILSDTITTITAGNTGAVTITGTTGGGNSWNTATNWSGNFVTKDVWGAIIAPGVTAQVQNTATLATPAYSGGLTMGAGSQLWINNAAGSQNALGTGPITFQDSTIRMTLNVGTVNFPALVLNGDATFTTGGNTEDNKTRNLTGGVSGAGDLTFVGRNNLVWNFNGASTYAGDLNLQAVDRYRVFFNTAGSAAVANITVTPRTTDARSAMIVLGADNAFATTTTLTLNGRGGNNSGNPYIGFARINMQGFNATVDKLFIDDVQMPAGDYVSVGDNGNLANPLNWIAGTGTLTVLTGPSTGSPYDTWATGGELFGDDANGDGVSNGLAFLLGASGPNVDALGLLPTVTETAGGLVLTFNMLDSASRGTAALSVEHSSDLGIGDAWTTVAVPDASGGPTSGVTFVVSGSGTLAVTATVGSAEAGGTGKLFGRLKATE